MKGDSYEKIDKSIELFAHAGDGLRADAGDDLDGAGGWYIGVDG